MFRKKLIADFFLNPLCEYTDNKSNNAFLNGISSNLTRQPIFIKRISARSIDPHNTESKVREMYNRVVGERTVR